MGDVGIERWDHGVQRSIPHGPFTVNLMVPVRGVYGAVTALHSKPRQFNATYSDKPGLSDDPVVFYRQGRS